MNVDNLPSWFGTCASCSATTFVSGLVKVYSIHPWRLTWNIVMEVWKIFPFWMRTCKFHVNLPGCIFYLLNIYYILFYHFSLLLLLSPKSISLAIISIMFAYLYIWQKISISIIVASRWLNHRYLKWLKTPNYQQLFSKFQDLVGLVVVLSHLTNQKKDIHKFASIHRRFNESSQQKDTQELYIPEV